MFNRKYIFKGSIFHCYVSLPECTLPATNSKSPWKALLGKWFVSFLGRFVKRPIFRCQLWLVSGKTSFLPFQVKGWRSSMMKHFYTEMKSRSCNSNCNVVDYFLQHQPKAQSWILYIYCETRYVFLNPLLTIHSNKPIFPRGFLKSPGTVLLKSSLFWPNYNISPT